MTFVDSTRRKSPYKDIGRPYRYSCTLDMSVKNKVRYYLSIIINKDASTSTLINVCNWRFTCFMFITQFKFFSNWTNGHRV